MTIARHEAMAGLWAQASEIAKGLDDADWQRPVPWTPAWTVADLISHLGALQSIFNGDPQPPEPDEFDVPDGDSPFDAAMAGPIAARRGWSSDQRIEELVRAGAAYVATLETTGDWLEQTPGPVGMTTKDGLFRVRSFDIWVHLQDLREALGMEVQVDDLSDGAAAAHDYVLGLTPWMFVKRAGAREGATMRVALGPPLDHDSVLTVVAGRATWDPTGDAGDCVIEGSPGAFTLLVAGRGSPQRWRDEGALHWAGPRAEEFVERARLF